MEPVSVLLVNHSLAFPPALTRFLRGQEEVIVVGKARGAEHATELALGLRPQVIVVDLAGPGLTGLATVSRLRKALPEVAIIVLTLPDADPYRHLIVTVGADECISRATLEGDLLPAIRRVT
jgi:two-component system response regulator NreC